MENIKSKKNWLLATKQNFREISIEIIDEHYLNLNGNKFLFRTEERAVSIYLTDNVYVKIEKINSNCLRYVEYVNGQIYFAAKLF